MYIIFIFIFTFIYIYIYIYIYLGVNEMTDREAQGLTTVPQFKGLSG